MAIHSAGSDLQNRKYNYIYDYIEEVVKNQQHWWIERLKKGNTAFKIVGWGEAEAYYINQFEIETLPSNYP